MLNALPAAAEAKAQLFYVAYYGRPADPLGESYWAGVIDATGGNLSAVTRDFGSSQEALDIYGSLSTASAVNRLYLQMFNRNADEAGLTYWVGQINAGNVRLSDLPIQLYGGARGTDLEVINNKVLVASAFTAALDTTPEILAYNGLAAMQGGVSLLAGVGASPASVQAAVAQVDGIIAQIVSGPVQPYVLTASAPAVTEGNSGATSLTFRLELDRAPTEPVTVNVATTGGTATAGVDYVPVSTTVTFAAGQTIAFVSVSVNGDAIVEADETVVLTIAGAQLAGTVTATGTIVNDDSAPPVLVPSYALSVSTDPLAVGNVTSANEGQTLYFTVSTENVQAGTVLTYIITGVSGADIGGAPLSGTVTIDATGAAVIPVTLAQDAVTEGNETLTLAVTTPGGALVRSVTVVDTSTTPVPVETYSVAASGTSVNEGGVVTYTISTVNVPNGTILQYEISGVQPADVSLGGLSGNVVVNNGAASVSLTLAQDNRTEGAETLSFVLMRNGVAVASAASVVVNDTSVGNFTVTATDIIAANNAARELSVVTTASADPVVNVAIASDVVTAAQGFLVQGNGNHSITAGAQGDVIRIDGSGNNFVSGGAGNDSIVGGSGNDTLVGGPGRDTLEGGGGNDTFIVGDGEFAGGIIRGGLGTDTLIASGTNDFSVGTLEGIEVIQLNSVATFTVAQLADVTTLAGDGSSEVTIQGGGSVDLSGVLVTDIARLTVASNTTVELSSANLAEIAEVVNAAAGAVIITDAAGYAVVLAKGGVSARVQVVDTLENVQANLAALAGAVSVSLGAVSVAQAAELIEAGLAGAVSYTLADTPANLALASTAVLQNAGGMVATSAANAVEAAAVEAAGGVMRAANGSATFSYSVADTAVNLASLIDGLNSASTVTVTTVATIAQAALIRGAATAGANPGADIPAGGKVLSYSVSGSAADLVANPAVLNAAANVTVTGTATVGQANVLAGATNTGVTTYSVSGTYAELTNGANAGGVNGAANLTVTGAITALQAADINALGNTGAKSYALADSLQVLLNLDAVSTGNASAVTPSGAPFTVNQVANLVAKFGGAKIANGSLAVVDSAANWAGVSAAQAAEIDVAGSTITGGVLSVAQATALKAAFSGGATPAYSLTDTAAALAGASAVVLAGATNLVATTAATMAQAVTIDAAVIGVGTKTYSIQDTAEAITGSTAPNAAAARNGALTITATGDATVAQALVIDGAAGTSTYNIADTAAAIAAVIVPGDANDVVDRATNVSVTGSASVAQVVAIQAATNSGTKDLSSVGLVDNVASLNAASAAVLAAVATVTVRDVFTNLNAAAADAIRASANSVVVEITQSQLAAMAATADVFKQEVDRIVVTDALSVADAADLIASTQFGSTAIFDVTDSAANLLLPANAAFVNASANLIVTGSATVAQAASLIALGNSGTLAYSLSDTASAVANAAAAVLNGAAAINVTGGTVSPAQAVTLAGLAVTGTYDVVGSAAALSAVAGAALTDGSVGTVTVNDGGTVSQTVGALAKIFGPGAYSAANYDIVDTAAAVGAANANLRGFAQNISLTGDSTVAQVAAVQSVQPMGQVLSYSLVDSAANIAAAAASLRNGATDITATGVADAVQAAAIAAATNVGVTSIEAVADSAAALAASSDAVLSLVAGTVTANTAATGAQASTLAGFSKAVSYSVLDTVDNVVASTGLGAAFGITATGTANAAQASLIQAASNTGPTSIGALTDSAEALASLSNAVLDLVAGAVTANTDATVEQAAVLAAFTKPVVYSISDSAANFLAATAAALAGAVDITVNGALTVSQAAGLLGAANSGTVTYEIVDSYQNIIADANVDGVVDADVPVGARASVLDGATRVTLSHPISLAQASQIDGLATAAVRYAIVDSDQNIQAALNADSAILTAATTVSTSAGTILAIENVSGKGLTIVTDKAGKEALPVGLDAADYLVVASVADMTGADADWYAARAASNFRVADTFENLSGGVPVVEATYSVRVTDAISVAQQAVIAAFLPTAANTHYSLVDTVANLVAAAAGVRNGATDIIASGTASNADVVALLGATNSGTTTIAAASLTAAQADALSFNAGEVITALTITGTATVAQATAIRADVTAGNVGSVSYSLNDATSTLAGAPAQLRAGATNITGTGVATAAQAQVLLSSTNTGTTTINAVVDTAEAVSGLVADANDTIATITATGTATVSQAAAIVALDARAGTTVNYSYTVRDTAEAILGASLAVLDATDNTGLQVVDPVSVSTAAALLAIDTADTTISIASMSVADTAVNLLAASNAVKANGNGVTLVTVQGAATVAQVGQISAQFLQAGVDIGGAGLVFNLTDSFANLSALGAVGARNAAGTITLTNASLTVAQANVAENWKSIEGVVAAAGSVVYHVADTAAAVAAAISAGGVMNDELRAAASITVTTSATVAQAARLSETSIGYNIADSALAVYNAYNSVNAVGAGDRGTIQNAGSVTLTAPATVQQYTGTATLRGLDEVVNLAGYSIADSAVNLIAAATGNAAVLAGAQGVALATDEDLSVAQATSLTALVNFSGFGGGFRVLDSVDNILTAPAGVLAAATSFTVEDTYASLVTDGGIEAIKLAFNIQDVNVRVTGATVTQQQLDQISTANGSGVISYSLRGTIAEVAGNSESLLSQAVDLVAGLDAPEPASVSDLLKILGAGNSGNTDVSVSVLNASGASAALLGSLAQYVAVLGANTADANDAADGLTIGTIQNMVLTGALTPAQVQSLLTLAAPGSARVDISAMNSSYLDVLAAGASGIQDLGIFGVLGNTNLTLTASQFAGLGAKFANGLTVTVDATGADDLQISAMASNIDNITGGGILNLAVNAADAAITDAVFSAVLGQATGAVVDASGATAAEVGVVLNNLPRIADNGLTNLVLGLADFNLLTSGTKLLLNQKIAALSGLVINGTPGADLIDLSSPLFTKQVVVNGLAGNDTILGGAGADSIDGGEGDDSLTGGLGNDTFVASSGNDVITDLSTGDVLVASGGATTVVANNVSAFVATSATSNTGAAVTINAAAGGATINVSDATGSTGYVLNGGAGSDNLIGSGFDDTITGNDGADSIDAGAGDDVIVFASAAELNADVTVIGGTGTDTIRMDTGIAALTLADADFADVIEVERLDLTGTGAQAVTLGVETNQAFATGITLTTNATAASLNLQGALSAVSINATGTNNGDTLVGGSAADTLVGGNGNDTITGNGGADSLVGGDGDDVFRFLNADFDQSDSVAGGADTDTIQIVDAATVVDADFTNVTSVERLLLGNFVNTVTLGDLAAAAGIATVVGGTGNDTLILTDDPLVAGSITAVRFESASGNDVFNIGGLTVTGTLALAGDGADADTIVATDGANISGLNAGGVTTAENLTLTGGITMTLDQHQALAIAAAGPADSVTLTTSGNFSGQAQVETYVLANAAGNVFTQVAGNTSVVGGTANDRIITSGTDSTRGALTVNLTTGGQDTVLIRNDAIGNNGVFGTQSGLGGRLVDWDGGDADSNSTTLNGTIAFWTAAGSNDGIDYVTITGFTAGNSGDRIAYLNGSTPVLIGGYADNVSLTTNNLSGLAVNSVIEIASAFQINDGTNLGAVATMLSQLNNVQDGNYYVVIYDGTSADSNAWIYAATATEGDGFDFRDTNGATSGYDTDTVELIGVLMGVGADTLTSQNFISSLGL